MTNGSLDDQKLINEAYNLAKKEFETEEFNTSQLWKLVSKSDKIDNKKGDEYINFYLELLQDVRFVQVANDKWKLRDYVTTEEFNRLANSKYSTVEYSAPEDKGDDQIIDELIDEETSSNTTDDSDFKEYEAEDIEDSEAEDEETTEEEEEDEEEKEEYEEDEEENND